MQVLNSSCIPCFPEVTLIISLHWSLPAGLLEGSGCSSWKPILEKQVLMERRVCFIPVASNGGRRRTPVQRPTAHCPSVGKSFYRQREGAACSTAQSALTVISKCHRWSGQHHLDCFKHSPSSVPGSVCSHFSEASSRICGSLCHGYSLVIR